MQRQSSASGILSDLKQPCVEIALWGITSLHNRLYLEQTLARYALGAGPLRAEKDKLSYRFLMSDWEQIIRPLVGSNSIAFETVKNYETDRDILPVKKKVYLVENDLDTLFALNVMLENAGYDVLLSHCARPLMEDILPPTDLFILDNCMPDGRGLRFTVN